MGSRITPPGDTADMLEIGKINTLPVLKLSPAGAVLASEEGEIFLPGKLVPAGTGPGDTIDVFVYRDTHAGLLATTIAPKAGVGEFALLEVKDAGSVGAFLDWGLDKDLLVPFAEQLAPMNIGEWHLVRVYLDNSGRVAASARLGRFLEVTGIPLQAGEEVDVMIHAYTDLGAKVIINALYPGLLFRSGIAGKPAPGTHFRGYVARVRTDGKIDVTLKKSGRPGTDQCREIILAYLSSHNGFLPLGDQSTPEAIGDQLQMSKKSFKKAIGGLYKEGLVELTGQGVKLRNR
jgi:predicted RNA-binding protein (virulence factor B family)